MLSFPNCKINLGLNILRKRADGFHDLETVFYPLNLRDCLEIIQDDSGRMTNDRLEIDGCTISQSGLVVDGETENNLCYRAYHLLKKDFHLLPAIKMHLHKIIPMGAGLGGGSADAAFTLQLISNLFDLKIPKENLLTYAAQLGSDAPFFIINRSCYATGRGERLEEIMVDLSEYSIWLVNPGIHINTGWAFSQLWLNDDPKKTIKEIVQQPIETWVAELTNDFENPVFEKYPEIEKIKKVMYEQDAVYSAMSGSGSSVFGIFHKNDRPVFDFPENYFIKNIAG